MMTCVYVYGMDMHVCDSGLVVVCVRGGGHLWLGSKDGRWRVRRACQRCMSACVCACVRVCECVYMCVYV